MDLAHDQFIHIRIIIGIVTGLSVTRLLTGLARFDRHPVRDRIYLAHLAWYAALFFLLCALLFPDRMEEYSGFAEYLHSRQKWFYGLLGVLFLADLVDTAIKGAGHLSSVGEDSRSRPKCAGS